MATNSSGIRATRARGDLGQVHGGEEGHSRAGRPSSAASPASSATDGALPGSASAGTTLTSSCSSSLRQPSCSCFQHRSHAASPPTTPLPVRTDSLSVQTPLRIPDPARSRLHQPLRIATEREVHVLQARRGQREVVERGERGASGSRGDGRAGLLRGEPQGPAAARLDGPGAQRGDLGTSGGAVRARRVRPAPLPRPAPSARPACRRR